MVGRVLFKVRSISQMRSQALKGATYDIFDLASIRGFRPRRFGRFGDLLSLRFARLLRLCGESLGLRSALFRSGIFFMEGLLLTEFFLRHGISQELLSHRFNRPGVFVPVLETRMSFDGLLHGKGIRGRHQLKSTNSPPNRMLPAFACLVVGKALRYRNI